MLPHSTDPINESRGPEVLTEILPLLRDVIQDREGKVINNSILFDTSSEDVGEALNLLIEELPTDISKPLLLIEAPITNEPLFEKLCQYVSLDKNAGYYQDSKMFLLKNHDFNISIIPINLEDRRTLLYIQSLQRRPQFLFTLWDHMVGGFENPINMDKQFFNESLKLKISL